MRKIQPKITIGIIGFGRFGRLLHAIFSAHWEGVEILIFSPDKKADGQKFFSLKSVCQADILIPCVPISEIPKVFKKIKPLLGGQTTVVDICSVKVFPVKWAREILGKKVPFIATHPMFGPDSSKNGNELKGHSMMIANISASPEVYKTYKNFWKNLGIKLQEMSPEEHDRFSAYTLNYVQYLGRISQGMGLSRTPLDTKSFKVLYDAFEIVVRDSLQLFCDMQNYNPFAREMRAKLLKSVQSIEKTLQKKQ